MYRKGDLPTSEALADREFGIFQPDLPPPNDERDMQLIVDAIKEVVDNVEELRE